MGLELSGIVLGLEPAASASGCGAPPALMAEAAAEDAADPASGAAGVAMASAPSAPPAGSGQPG